MASPADILDLKKQVVEGLRLLVAEDVLYGAGHLSVKIPDTNSLIINPRYPGNLADVEDLCIVDIETCKRLEGPGPIPSETHIHTEIFKRRPDVESVTHCHPKYTTLLGCLDDPWVPGGTFDEGFGIYPEAHLVDSAKLGANLAQCLGDRYTCLQKGHGVSIGGPGIQGTVMLAINLEKSAADAFTLMSMGVHKPARHGRKQTKEERAFRMRNEYRTWPYLLMKNGLKPKEQIKAENRPAPEGTVF